MNSIYCKKLINTNLKINFNFRNDSIKAGKINI